MNPVSISNPRSLSSGKILLDIVFDTGDSSEFIASSSDTEQHGRELYNRAMAEEFGEVVAYLRTDEQLLQVAKDSAGKMLVESDMVALRCFKAGVEFPESWKEYVQALRLVVRAAEWGDGVQIPPKPEYPQGT